MSVIINQIELKNWFNYSGNYENNVVKFSDGLNIIVGDNNSGKTKLHNAVRWILKNSVIIIEGNDAIETEIAENYLRKVINHTTLRNSKIGDSITFGVRIMFTRHLRDQKEKYLLTKEFVCRKEVNDLIFLRDNKIVQFIDSRTNKPRTIKDDFIDIAKLIISNNFIDFFFIEGEQLSQLTPLEGDKLQSTINSIVYLDVLDHLVSKSTFLEKKIDAFYDEILKEEKNQNKEISDAITAIQDKKKIIEDYKDSIKDFETEIKTNESLIATYKKKAENSKKKMILYQEYEELRKKVGEEEAKKESFIQNFMSSLMNQSTFAISKLSDDSNIKDIINKTKSEIQTFIAKRKTEIDNNLSEEDQKIIMSLERSQPKTEILEQMVQENHCFVCNTPLSKKSKDFIKNKLIPFFQDETKGDDQIERLTQIQEFFKHIELETTKYFHADNEYFNDVKEKVIELTTNIINAQNDLTEFIENNGK